MTIISAGLASLPFVPPTSTTAMLVDTVLIAVTVFVVFVLWVVEFE